MTSSEFENHQINQILRQLTERLSKEEVMKHKNLPPKDNYPLAFYDDFADLRK